MSKLKGVKKLNKAIALAFDGFGIAGFQLGKEYGFYLIDNTIDYCLVEGKIEDKLFNQFIKERFGYEVTNTFIISILHEIGHYMTLEDIYNNDFVYEFCHAEKERIDKEMEKATKKKEVKRLEYQYFSLPDELAATAWAVDYAKNNAETLNLIWEQVQTALTQFYLKNITEGN